MNEEFSVRATRVLASMYHGIHHAPEIHKRNVGNDLECWWVNHYGHLATFDFNKLTLLVIAAHDNCVRASISHSGPRMVKISLWPRVREGDITARHPTIENVIATIRRMTP